MSLKIYDYFKAELLKNISRKFKSPQSALAGGPLPLKDIKND